MEHWVSGLGKHLAPDEPRWCFFWCALVSLHLATTKVPELGTEGSERHDRRLLQRGLCVNHVRPRYRAEDAKVRSAAGHDFSKWTTKLRERLRKRPFGTMKAVCSTTPGAASLHLPASLRRAEDPCEDTEAPATLGRTAVGPRVGHIFRG